MSGGRGGPAALDMRFGRLKGREFASNEDRYVVCLPIFLGLYGPTVITVRVDNIAICSQIDLRVPMVLFLVCVGWTMWTRMIFIHVHCHCTRLKCQIEHRNEDKTHGAACPGIGGCPQDAQNAQLIDSDYLFGGSFIPYHHRTINVGPT